MFRNLSIKLQISIKQNSKISCCTSRSNADVTNRQFCDSYLFKFIVTVCQIKTTKSRDFSYNSRAASFTCAAGYIIWLSKTKIKPVFNCSCLYEHKIDLTRNVTNVQLFLAQITVVSMYVCMYVFLQHVFLSFGQ